MGVREDERGTAVARLVSMGSGGWGGYGSGEVDVNGCEEVGIGIIHRFERREG